MKNAIAYSLQITKIIHKGQVLHVASHGNAADSNLKGILFTVDKGSL